MRLAVLGGNSPAGQQLIKRALRHGYEVTTLAAAPESYPLHHARLTLTPGTLQDPTRINEILCTAHAVLVLLDDTYHESTISSIINSMERYGLQRIILSVEDLAKKLHNQDPFLLKTAAALKHARLDWTLVHALPVEVPVQAKPDFNVTRTDFAKFMLGQVTDVTHLQAAVVLSN